MDHQRPGTAGDRDVTGGVGAGPEPGNSALDEAMARVGDRWTLLIVDALLEGPRRFKDLEAALPGLAPNVLTARLRRLESEGLVVASPYSQRPARYEYGVSAEGRELAGALRLLARWGARAAGTEADGPRHRSCGTPLEAHWYCPTCERVTDRADDDVAWL
jgi:DNA-binding HxlR family transcriptional regulator